MTPAHFLKNRIWAILTLGLWLMAAGAHAEETQTDPSGFGLPDGSAEAGRAAFRSLGCAACHTVGHDPGMSGIQTKQPAPVLTFGPETNRADVAQSIISPSHTIAYGFGQGDPEDVQKSAMLDLTDRMTVRELIDIVAYLRSDPDGTASSTR